jgi:hypothetical protein
MGMGLHWFRKKPIPIPAFPLKGKESIAPPRITVRHFLMHYKLCGSTTCCA